MIDTAEDVVAAYLGIDSPSSGRHPIYEHTVIERIIPAISRSSLEVSGGPVSSIQSIYTTNGTTLTPIGKNPFSMGWTIGTRSSTGSAYTFDRGQEYVVEYRTGWATGTRTLYDFTNTTPETPGNFGLLGWTVQDGDDATLTNLAQGSATRMRWTQTARNEFIVSPTISIAGASYPFVSLRFGLQNTPTLSDWEIVVEWQASGGNDYFGEERSMRFVPPYRVTDAAADPLSIIQLDMTGDREGKPFEELQGLAQPIEPARRWIDDTVTKFRVQLRSAIPASTSIAAETLPVIDIDWIALSDGNTITPSAVGRAILVTAASLSSTNQGVVAERVGDYSVQFDNSEANMILPASARRLLLPHRRPEW
jgi:hypothetical protein